MHALIYAGSLKVIPAEHSSLIGTHSSTVSFLGLSYGWAVPTQLFQRGVNLSLSCSLASLRGTEERGNGKWKNNSTHSADKLPTLTLSRWRFFHSISLTRPTFLCSCSLCPLPSLPNVSLCSLKLQLLSHTSSLELHPYSKWHNCHKMVRKKSTGANSRHRQRPSYTHTFALTFVIFKIFKMDAKSDNTFWSWSSIEWELGSTKLGAIVHSQCTFTKKVPKCSDRLWL